jgi:AraC-like DNA-binding protein
MTGEPLILLPSQHVRMALKLLSSTPDLIERLLQGSGLVATDLENPRFSLSMPAFRAIIDNAEALYGAGWFLNLPILWSIEVQSEFGLAIRFARNVETALDVLCQFAHVRWPFGRVDGIRTKAGYRLDFTPLVDFSPSQWQMLTTLVALNFQTTFSTMIGPSRSDHEGIVYEMADDAPAYAARLDQLLLGRVSWGNPRMRFLVGSAHLHKSSMLANDTSFAAMIHVLREHSTRTRSHPGWTARARTVLATVTHGQLTAAEVARRLGLSRRTFERRLAEEGVSFRPLLEESLRDRLLDLVDRPGITAQAVAEMLGYHDASSIQRACRRWFGTPFGKVRAGQGETGLQRY